MISIAKMAGWLSMYARVESQEVPGADPQLYVTIDGYSAPPRLREKRLSVQALGAELLKDGIDLGGK